MQPRQQTAVPSGVHVLTAMHGVGAIACLVMAAGSAISEQFRLSLIMTPGSALMMDLFGQRVWVFLIAIAVVLSALCYGSWRLRTWARPLTIVCYSIGVIGGLWEVTIGIRAGLLAATINAGVVAYACTGQVREAYQSGEQRR